MYNEVNVLQYPDGGFPTVLSFSTLAYANEQRLLVTTSRSLSILHHEDGYFRLVPVPLIGINGDAEIISCDAFVPNSRANATRQPVLAIAYHQPPKSFVSIYTTLPHANCDYQVFEVPFVPMQLTHMQKNNFEGYILCGNTKEIQAFALSNSNSDNNKEKFTLLPEETANDFFPELAKPTSSIMSLEVRHIRAVRIIATGHFDGGVRVSCNSSSSNDAILDQKADFDGPISSVIPYNFHFDETNTKPEFDVIVSSGAGYAWCFQNVVAHGFSQSRFLLSSDIHNTILSGAVGDFDMDGNDEIVIGCQDNYLIVYSIDESPPNKDDDLHIFWKRRFSTPVYAICFGDFNQDGIDELIVATTNGIHVLVPNLDQVARKVNNALDLLEEIRQLSSG